MKTPTVFSWGYWGWGTHTDTLVKAFNAVETARGFDPPLFVDIRISRSVRAPGFRERAFENLLGPSNYRWMNSLGNLTVKTHTGPSVQIARPEAVNELLDLAIELGRKNRRLLFFCSCDVPMYQGQKCHRYTVADLLLEAAGKGPLPVEVVEWPGGEPITFQLDSTRKEIGAIRKGQKWIHPSGDIDIAWMAGIPWYSLVKLMGPGDGTSLEIFTGPARYSTGRWVLPALREAGASAGHEAWLKNAEDFRRKERLDSRQS